MSTEDEARPSGSEPSAAEPGAHEPCCSSHGVNMDCARYRRTHFVEVRPCCLADAAALATESETEADSIPWRLSNLPGSARGIVQALRRNGFDAASGQNRQAEEFGVDLEDLIGQKLVKVFSRGWRESSASSKGDEA